jgi:hypothetical protein
LVELNGYAAIEIPYNSGTLEWQALLCAVVIKVLVNVNKNEFGG